MLKFLAFCPHPPIIVPTIGKKKDLEKVKKTIKAMERLRSIFEERKIESLIIVSPHSQLSYYQMSLNISPSFYGDFKNFSDFKSKFYFNNDIQILQKLTDKIEKEKIPFSLITNQLLDHGILVPLYFLAKNVCPKIVPISYSFLDRKTHFYFGKIIKQVIEMDKKPIAFIASGDLSHRLTFDAPAGYSEKGEIFDRTIIELLKKRDIQGILNLKQDIIESAGECGYRSLIILLGIIVDNYWEPEILSYEGPFGVGYLVANFI